MTKLTEIKSHYLPKYEYYTVESINVCLFSENILKLEEMQKVLDFVAKHDNETKFDVIYDLDDSYNTAHILINACKPHTPETLKEYEKQKEKAIKQQKELEAKYQLKQLKRLIAIHGIPSDIDSLVK